MTDFSQLSIRELLGMATRAEIEANKTYSDLANAVKNPLLKEKTEKPIVKGETNTTDRAIVAVITANN